MMKTLPPYEIAVDRMSGILTATLRGFWDLPTTIEYGEQLTVNAAQLSALTRTPKWLIDLSGLEVQSTDITTHMAGVVRELTSKYHPKVATVLSRALVALQARRVADSSDHGAFASVDEAREWLAHDSQ